MYICLKLIKLGKSYFCFNVFFFIIIILYGVNFVWFVLNAQFRTCTYKFTFSK